MCTVRTNHSLLNQYAISVTSSPSVIFIGRPRIALRGKSSTQPSTGSSMTLYVSQRSRPASVNGNALSSPLQNVSVSNEPHPLVAATRLHLEAGRAVNAREVGMVDG